MLLYISSQLLTSQEETPISKLFLALDANGDGKLSKEELRMAVCLDPSINAQELDEVFDSCDMDKSGFIDYSEFLTVAMTWNQVLQKEKVKMIFNYFDQNHSGSINIEELRKSFPQINEKEWKKFFSEVDKNGDGDISLDEFKEYITKLIEEL
jgi:calcium-dependent protein kinase